MARHERKLSEPPRRITALPAFRQSTPASAATLGRLSKITPMTPSGTRRRQRQAVDEGGGRASGAYFRDVLGIGRENLCRVGADCPLDGLQRAILPLRRRQRQHPRRGARLEATRGRIVNIGSIQSFVHVSWPNSAAYTTSKHGVLGFTRALAAELGKDGVRVNAIGPGLIETRINEQVRANNPELVKIFMDHTPLGRAGKPEDIAGPAIFLASDLSAYVTGSIVMADGGYRTV